MYSCILLPRFLVIARCWRCAADGRRPIAGTGQLRTMTVSRFEGRRTGVPPAKTRAGSSGRGPRLFINRNILRFDDVFNGKFTCLSGVGRHRSGPSANRAGTNFQSRERMCVSQNELQCVRSLATGRHRFFVCRRNPARRPLLRLRIREMCSFFPEGSTAGHGMAGESVRLPRPCPNPCVFTRRSRWRGYKSPRSP